MFDVAYLQTRSFGTDECAHRHHRDGHLVLASDCANAHLQPPCPPLRYLNVSQLGLACCQKATAHHSASDALQQRPRDTKPQTGRRGFIQASSSTWSHQFPHTCQSHASLGIL